MLKRMNSEFVRRVTSLTAALVMATSFNACSDGAGVTVPPPPPTAVSLSIIPASVNLDVGQATFLSARAVDSANRAVSTVVVWTSDNPGIATIGRTDGRLTAIAAGTATMTAAAGTLQATAVVTVRLPLPTTIRLSVSEVVMSVGSTERVTAQVYDQDGGPMIASVTWSSRNPSVASVSGDGTVTGTGIGTTVVVAASGAAAAEVTVHIDANLLVQWARSATASSQYDVDMWAAYQATGTPDVFTCADDPRAWASVDASGVDWLELNYDQPVRPTEIRILEVWAPGSIVKVEVKDLSGTYRQVYSASPQPLVDCLRTLIIPVTGVTEYISTVLVTIDQRQRGDWNEIDAVRLTGFRRP